MKMKRVKKALSLFLCMVLIVAMALVTTGCNDKAGKNPTAAVTAEAETTAKAEMVQETGTESQGEQENKEAKLATKEVTVLGEGAKTFEFSVIDLEGNETWFEIHTDEETVGGALIALNLLEGDEGPYGLYVKTVNGITADYDKDKVYWAFYVDDNYGTAGVELTEIEEGTVYSFRISK